MALHTSRRARLITSMIAATLTAATVSFTASAGVIPPATITVQVNNGTPWTAQPPGTDNGNGTFTYGGSYSNPNWGMSMSILGDPDPFVSAVVSFTNNTLTTNLYTIVVTMPTMVIPGSSLMGGSVGGSLTDTNLSGSATVVSGSGPGTFLFHGMIDGGLVPGAGLHPNPATFIAPFSGASASIPRVSFGLPGPTMPGPAVASSIGIQLQFTLTPGDSIGLTSVFQVEPVPAPGAIALLGLAGLAGARRRRRC